MLKETILEDIEYMALVNKSTLTTDYCEIGLHKREIYFVFILDSEKLTKNLFDSLKNQSRISIYGFKNFNKNLYPTSDFNYGEFSKSVKNDKYVQIQFLSNNLSLDEKHNARENT